jgi:hypothetical protein
MYTDLPRADREAIIHRLGRDGQVIGRGEDRCSVAGFDDFVPSEVAVVDIGPPVTEWKVVARAAL